MQMPRANRHYIPGYLWHITHRCHKKEVLLKFDRDRRRWIEWLAWSDPGRQVEQVEQAEKAASGIGGNSDPMKIDSHHHFIKYNAIEYDWIDNSLAKLRRDFLPADLKAEIDAAGIDGLVSVAARQIVEETSALLTYAKANPFILGVVGWVPLVSPGVVAELERFAPNTKLRGVRHVLHDEPDPLYMVRDDFNEGIRRLKPFDLSYDILIFERHLTQTIQFVDRHPEQVFVLDHIAKPRIKEGLFEPWATKIRELAKRENVFCKLSGMVTEADWSGWTEEHNYAPMRRSSSRRLDPRERCSVPTGRSVWWRPNTPVG